MDTFKLAVLLWILLLGSRGLAQEVGDAADALPGVVHVGVPSSGKQGIHGAATVGYGHTEAQPGDAGPHHRGTVVAALGWSPIELLATSLVLKGRYDKHPDDAEGSDDGLQTVPLLLGRVSHRADDLAGGGQLRLSFPGEDGLSVAPSAIVADAVLLGSLSLSQTTIAANAGFRWDNSAKAAPNQVLRPGDRLAIGLSDFNAILAGLGGSHRFGQSEVLAEASWDLLIGSGAPAADISPLRASVGFRQTVTESLQLVAIAEVNFSSRPSIVGDAPFIPIEPRYSGFLGVRILPAPERPIEPIEYPVPKEVAPKEAPKPAPAPKLTLVRGTLVDAEGKPIPRATVQLKGETYTRTATTGADGSYRFDDVPAGRATLTVEAKGYEPMTSELDTSGQELIEAPPMELQAEAPVGQIRGLIRSFRGEGIRAKIRVEPIGTETTTDDQGVFAIDVEPGQYRVLITAEGFLDQKREIRVEKDGVTILNAELRRRR